MFAHQSHSRILLVNAIRVEIKQHLPAVPESPLIITAEPRLSLSQAVNKNGPVAWTVLAE